MWKECGRVGLFLCHVGMGAWDLVKWKMEFDERIVTHVLLQPPASAFPRHWIPFHFDIWHQNHPLHAPDVLWVLGKIAQVDQRWWVKPLPLTWWALKLQPELSLLPCMWMSLTSVSGLFPNTWLWEPGKTTMKFMIILMQPLNLLKDALIWFHPDQVHIAHNGLVCGLWRMSSYPCNTPEVSIPSAQGIVIADDFTWFYMLISFDFLS